MSHMHGLGSAGPQSSEEQQRGTFLTLEQRTTSLARGTIPEAAAKLFPELLHLCH